MLLRELLGDAALDLEVLVEGDRPGAGDDRRLAADRPLPARCA
ncbi:hypothetical protein [Nocardioides sp. L-11A]|nr:hypothetical protein QJ852_15670 [Nocardioides sp. L-11A]